MARAPDRRAAPVPGDGPPARQPRPPGAQCVAVQIGEAALPGELGLLPDARGLVVFADGSGCSRHGPRDRRLAEILHGYRFDTLRFDLLAEAERADRRRAVDCDLLARRVAMALQWARTDERTAALGTGLLGAGTGSAAALMAAARQPGRVGAVVSRGGRPDLADGWLARVQAPTLLIVGGHDPEVLGLNRAAQRRLPGASRLEVVPGATHRFDEAGALETVAHLAGSWFADHLPLRRG